MTPLPLIDLRPGYRITRVIRGGWQLAGGAIILAAVIVLARSGEATA